jgi:hypothetical protein
MKLLVGLLVFLGLSGFVFASEEVIVRHMVFNKSEGFVKCFSVCEDKTDKQCVAECEVK